MKRKINNHVKREKVNKVSMVNLIKAGCFDKLEKKSRIEIMKEYIDMISDKKQRLTLQNMQMLILL